MDKKEFFHLDEKKNYHRTAEIIMRIWSSSSKIIKIYIPQYKNLSDIKNKGRVKSICDGVTYGRVEQIIIAAKDYENETQRDDLKDLIANKFCHYAAYEMFCND